MMPPPPKIPPQQYHCHNDTPIHSNNLHYMMLTLPEAVAVEVKVAVVAVGAAVGAVALQLMSTGSASNAVTTHWQWWIP
jgi:adenylyl- and sulfurtransferase ThiI